MTGRLSVILLLASALAAPAAAGAQAWPASQAEGVQWTPVSASKFGYRLQMPCTEAEIDAYQQENDFRRKSGAVGCETKDYKAIAFVMTDMPPSFFAELVAKSRNDRIPPLKLAARDNLRIRDFADPAGNQLFAQFTDLGSSRYLLISFEQKNAAARSGEVAEKLFNSLEMQPQ